MVTFINENSGELVCFQLDCECNPSDGALFVVLFCYFAFLVFGGYPGWRLTLCMGYASGLSV